MKCLALVGLLLCRPAGGATIKGVTFAERNLAYGTELRLVGSGLQRYMVFYKVCVAGFYLPAGIPAGLALTDQPKRLEIEYFHKISAEQFAALTLNGIRNNSSAEQFQAVQQRVKLLNQLYRDVKPGDRYSITYVPDKGTVLARNGTFQGTIQGADFARAVFSIWLGDKPLSTSLKEALLGAP